RRTSPERDRLSQARRAQAPGTSERWKQPRWRRRQAPPLLRVARDLQSRRESPARQPASRHRVPKMSPTPRKPPPDTVASHQTTTVSYLPNARYFANEYLNASGRSASERQLTQRGSATTQQW